MEITKYHGSTIFGDKEGRPGRWNWECGMRKRIRFRNIDLNRKDRANPPARRGCSAYASESDTINLNIQS